MIALLIGLALGLLVGYFALNADRPWLWLPVGHAARRGARQPRRPGADGAVIDFIDPIAWPAFNLADAAIVLGRAGAAVRGRGAAGHEDDASGWTSCVAAPDRPLARRGRPPGRRGRA